MLRRGHGVCRNTDKHIREGSARSGDLGRPQGRSPPGNISTEESLCTGRDALSPVVVAVRGGGGDRSLVPQLCLPRDDPKVHAGEPGALPYVHTCVCTYRTRVSTDRV